MSVPNQTPYIIYNANGLTTVFPFEFYIINASDIQVTINGTLVTSGYSVSGAGNVGGGDVIFITPPANGSVVMLERVVPTYRLTDYQDNGDLLADTVNKDFDRLWMAIQRSFIYLGLALRRPLFGGPFNAEGYRIEKLADPVNDQDAATKKYVETISLARTLRVPESTVQPVPPVSLRANQILAFNAFGDPIAVPPASGSASDVLIELAKPTGAGRIGYGDETVDVALSRHDTDFSRIISLDERLEVPPNEYSGNKHWTPIFEEGHQLTNYVFKTPVHVDFQFSSDPLNVESGPLFTFGRDDLSGSAAFFSQDSYEVSGVTTDGGSGEFAVFEPWTGHMATISNNRIINPDVGNKWALNFKAQNWWPHVIGNTYMEYNDAKGNFVKAVDDGGDASDRYTGNSRLLISNNRCAWAGLEAGGIMSYTSAVAVTLRDNSAQNAKTAVIFGYPSTFSVVDGLYTEMAFGNQQAIQLGDNTASDGHNVISEILIKNVYANYHALNTNRFIVPGNTSVLMNRLEVDRVYISNTPSTGFIQPVISVNDLQYQNVIAGKITAKDTPLLPLTSNHISVIDKYNANIPALNGDIVYADINTTAIPANSSTAVAPGWFARSNSATTFTRSGSGIPSQALRMSRYIASILSNAGATTSIIYEHPRADLVNGEVVTIQALYNATAELTFSVNIYVFNDNGARTTLLSKTLIGGGSWKEITYTVAVSGVETATSFIVVEIGTTTPSATNIFVTGHRMNRGEFGLCARANAFSYAETQRMKSDHSYIVP